MKLYALFRLERIKRVFYRKYPNSNIVFNYRVGPLSSQSLAKEEKLIAPISLEPETPDTEE